MVSEKKHMPSGDDDLQHVGRVPAGPDPMAFAFPKAFQPAALGYGLPVDSPLPVMPADAIACAGHDTLEPQLAVVTPEGDNSAGRIVSHPPGALNEQDIALADSGLHRIGIDMHAVEQ